ncbi:yxcA [Bacillus atrophaeus UCMB-5137]|nr:yxcA [Bacillus atrophaeus UCMB-5137]
MGGLCVLKVQHKKELKFYCFVMITVVFVVLTVISFLSE